MRIAFYMPFKALGHANPSGDLIIGSELFDYLKEQGHAVQLVSRLRTRWIYWKPWQLLALPFYWAMAVKRARRFKADVWLSYHSYYKAPDLVGAIAAACLHIPYVIFQGIYATKYRRRIKTLPGFWLNRQALNAADLVFSNKRRDHHNLKRIIPPEKLVYVAPGIRTELFPQKVAGRTALRKAWGALKQPVVMTAAMFRPGVKTQGLRRVIKACALLQQKGYEHLLVIAGDGEARTSLQKLAQAELPRRHIFLGKIPRDQLCRYFSAADLFAFPGIQESLGMVYLEAQACGLPVVALGQWGAGEAVVHHHTGILVKSQTLGDFADAIARLLGDIQLRQRMGHAARKHVLKHHDLRQNYRLVDSTIRKLI